MAKVGRPSKAELADRALKVSKENMLPLPEGAKVVRRPDLFDLYRKGRGTGDKWIAYVQRLMTMSATESLAFDLNGMADIKKHRNAVIWGIRDTAKKMGFNKHIKYALIGTTLYVTA